MSFSQAASMGANLQIRSRRRPATAAWAGDGLGVGEASPNITMQPSSLLSSAHHADLIGHGSRRPQPSGALVLQS